jgi:6-phosphogluconolactonase (cycloisomerase 2 family)
MDGPSPVGAHFLLLSRPANVVTWSLLKRRGEPPVERFCRSVGKEHVMYVTAIARHTWATLALAALWPGLGLVPATFGQATDRAIFVANNGNLEGSVTAFAVHADGTLAQVNRVITGSRPDMSVPCPGCNPYEISITPNGHYLVTGHASTNDPYEQLSFFEVAGDGSITEIAFFSVLGTPMDVAWITDELLAVTRTDASPNQVVIYHFDPEIPALTEIDVDNVGTFSTYLAVHPSRQYLYVNDSGAADTLRAFSIAPNGMLTLIDSEPTGSYYNLELAVSPDGTKLYAAGGITHVVLGFNIGADGKLTPMAGSPFPEFGSSPSNVSVSSDNLYLLVGHGTDATVRSASINQATGALTYTGNLFDVGLQGTLGDVQSLDDLFFVTDNSTAIDGIMGVYSFTLNANGSFTQNGPITWTDGIGPRSVAVWKPTIVPGDLNCDGGVDFGDINPFIQILTDFAAWQATHPTCPPANGDVNTDGTIDFGDINPFIALLTG